MYSGVYTGGAILPKTSKIATWGNKQKIAKVLASTKFLSLAVIVFAID